jgi:hypothetical protein
MTSDAQQRRATKKRQACRRVIQQMAFIRHANDIAVSSAAAGL